jgi:peptidoglycan biosynthesis protein MviN/MurJ (putative lipid II flippase)
MALFPNRKMADTPPLGSRSLAAWSIALLAALNALPPLQRLVASSVDASGAAQFDYAARGLQVVTQLLIGGLVISSLPDWTTMRHDAPGLRRQVTRASSSAFLLLIVAASVALVAIEPMVGILLERGAFGPDDTVAVSLLVVILLPGFVAEGLTLVLTQALLATKQTRQFLWINASRFLAHGIMTLLLGTAYGAIGVAAAYSISLVMTAAWTGIVVIRAGLAQWNSSLIARVATVAASAIAAALLLSLLGRDWAWVSGAAVLAVAGSGAYLLRLSELVPPGLQRIIPRMAGPA